MLALTEFRRRLASYPRGDPRYVSSADEQIEDLKKVTIGDVRQFYQEFYGASVGEVLAAAALIEKLRALNIRILLTSGTVTSAAITIWCSFTTAWAL